MKRVFLLPLAAAVVSIAGCVSEPAVTAPDCAEHAAVARQLAELHQYGGDLQGHIADLAQRGASQADIAAYQRMAATLASVPTLAGDGGREMGIELGLAEIAPGCRS